MLPDFTHHIVRDLAWAAFTAPLMDGSTLPLRDPLQDSLWRKDPGRLVYLLQQLDAEPGQLAALFPHSRDRRLGNYYERLWHALLTLAPDVHIVAHNIALRDAGRGPYRPSTGGNSSIPSSNLCLESKENNWMRR